MNVFSVKNVALEIDREIWEIRFFLRNLKSMSGFDTVMFSKCDFKFGKGVSWWGCRMNTDWEYADSSPAPCKSATRIAGEPLQVYSLKFDRTQDCTFFVMMIMKAHETVSQNC